MRVLQVITRFDFGGAENYVRELSNELANQGCEVFVFSKYGRQVSLLDPSVRFINAYFYSRLILTQAFNLVRIIRKHKIDVVHAHQRFPIISACIAGLLTRTPVVATVHGRVRHDLRSKLSRKIPTRFIFVSDRVLTVSKYYNELIHKSVIIHNGIPRPTINYKFTPNSIGYISRIDSKHSNVLVQLINVVTSLSVDIPGISLSIYGDGDYLEKIQELANENNQRLGYGAVMVHGYVESLSVAIEVPELVLGVGRVAIESAYKGCSVISVNNKRMGHLISSENYQFYRTNNFVDINGDPPTKELLYTEISKFFRNKDKNRLQSMALIQQFHDDFDIEVITRQVINIYSESIKRTDCMHQQTTS